MIHHPVLSNVGDKTFFYRGLFVSTFKNVTCSFSLEIRIYFFHEIPVDVFSFLFSLNLNEHLTFIGCGKQEGLYLQGLLCRSKQAGTSHLSHLI